MNGKTSRALGPFAALLVAALLIPATAQAVLERVGPVSAVNGYPIWYQDKTGITLEFCSPTNAAELAGGYCLLLPGDTVAPEIFPTAFFDEHFYWDGSTVVDLPLIPGQTKAGRAVLVQALEGAFATGPVIPGEQMVFGRFRFDIRDMPLSGTYTIYTPFGIRVFPDIVGGLNSRLFYTEDIGIACPPGDFTCALQAGIGPFLLPSDEGAGGAELPPWTDAAIPGKRYIADPARLSTVTGSVLPDYVTPLGTFNANRFRIEVTDNLGVTRMLIDTENFSLVGRLYEGNIPGRTTVDRASYAHSAGNNVSVDVYVTAEPTLNPRVPGAALVPPVFPALRFYDAPCVGTGAPLDPLDPLSPLGPPYAAPAGVTPVALTRFGNVQYGHSEPLAVPAGVCVEQTNAPGGPHFDPAPLGDQIFISDATYLPAGGGTLTVRARSSDEFAPPELSLGAFGDLAANVVMTNGLAVISPLAAVPHHVHVLSQQGGNNTAQVSMGRPPATGVALSAVPGSPTFETVPVAFNAVGQGSFGYEYRFWWSTDGGTTFNLAQDWNINPTYSLPTSTPVGSYQIRVDVRTNPSVLVPDATATITHVVGIGPAKTVSLLANRTSPAPVNIIPVETIFTAQGGGSSGTYEYRFSLNGVVVQDYGSPAGASYTLPASTPIGTYQVTVDTRTDAARDVDATNTVTFQLVAPAAATGVTVTPSVVSPSAAGQSVVFTAQGAGSSGYQYQFWYNSGAGQTLAQAWSATNTWTLPGSFPIGIYAITVEVRTTTTVVRDAQTVLTGYQVGNLRATGVTVTASKTSPQPIGSLVAFTAQGVGGSGTYEYQFFLNTGTGNILVQPYSTLATWTPPPFTAASNMTVTVQVRTNATVAQDAVGSTTFVIGSLGATGVTLTPSLSSPQPFGQAVTFQAAGVGGTGTYEYQFWYNAGAGFILAQAYSTTSTWTMPATQPVASYQVRVQVRTNPTVAQDAVTTIPFQIGNSRATGVTVGTTPASPQLANVPVDVTAAGVGGTGAYLYEFWYNRGTGQIRGQAYSTNATWAMPTTLPAATYTITVLVKTNATTAADAQVVTTFVKQ